MGIAVIATAAQATAATALASDTRWLPLAPARSSVGPLAANNGTALGRTLNGAPTVTGRIARTTTHVSPMRA